MKRWFRTWFRLALVASVLWLPVVSVVGPFLRGSSRGLYASGIDTGVLFIAGLVVIWVLAVGVPWVFAGFVNRGKPTEAD